MSLTIKITGFDKLERGEDKKFSGEIDVAISGDYGFLVRFTMPVNNLESRDSAELKALNRVDVYGKSLIALASEELARIAGQ
jgi:hypothetical protein